MHTNGNVENGVELKSLTRLKSTEKLETKDFAKEYEKDIVTGIIGNGNFGGALASRLTKLGISTYVGSRLPERKKLTPDNTSLVTYEDAAKNGNIIFLTIPSRYYDAIVPSLKSYLDGKIVVDVSNPEKLTDPCHAIRLQSLLSDSYVVKAFNTISAWTMENDIFGGGRNTYICGDNINARQIISQLASEMGFTAIDRGRLRAAEIVEKMPLQLFPEWRIALWITLAVLIIELFYYWLRLFGAKKNPQLGKDHKILFHSNRIIAWTTLWLLALVYLPGCIAGYVQLIRGTKYSYFPNWLDTWMKARKQLGLIALTLGLMHACMSCMLLAGEYISGMVKQVQIPNTRMFIFRKFKWNVEISLLFAVLAITTMAILGITSLPTVNVRMTWREWDFVQSKIGYTCLIFSTAHVLFYAYRVYDTMKLKFNPWGMPPAVFFMSLLPGLVLIMKLILLLPGIRGRLQKIRQGWERKGKDALPNYKV